MRLPPQLVVPIGRSRIALALIAAIAGASVAVLATLPLPWSVFAPAALGVLAWAVDRARVVALQRSPRSVVEVRLTGDRLIVVRYWSGALAAGFVRASSYVSPSVTTIVWKPDHAWRSQALPILPDMLSAEDFRRLRVMLRYGRSEVVAGAPASQA